MVINIAVITHKFNSSLYRQLFGKYVNQKRIFQGLAPKDNSTWQFWLMGTCVWAYPTYTTYLPPIPTRLKNQIPVPTIPNIPHFLLGN